MREDEVYFYTKEWFKSKGFNIIAGQPPKGSDNIPVLEIKDSSYSDKGSKGSFKPDLITINSQNIVIIECKPKFDNNDKEKLESILFNEDRKLLLYEQLNQRNLLIKSSYDQYYPTFKKFNNKIKFCLSNSSSNMNYEYLSTLQVKEKFELSILSDPLNINYKIK
mgnify:CR=1 FL=1